MKILKYRKFLESKKQLYFNHHWTQYDTNKEAFSQKEYGEDQ